MGVDVEDLRTSQKMGGDVELRKSTKEGLEVEKTYQAINVIYCKIRARIPIRHQRFVRHLILPHVVDRCRVFLHQLRNGRMVGRFILPVAINTQTHVCVVSVQRRQVKRRNVVEHEIARSTGIKRIYCHKHAVRKIREGLPSYLAVCQERVDT